MDILGWNMLDGPITQGSKSIRNGSVAAFRETVSEGPKERRNDASSFKCLIESVMTGLYHTLRVAGDRT
jgi:hypothetical protein